MNVLIFYVAMVMSLLSTEMIVSETQVETDIIGLWALEDDLYSWKLKFENNGNVIWSSAGKSTTYNYIISSTSCTDKAPTQEKWLFLHSSNKEWCYLIHGITTSVENDTSKIFLSIEAIGNPRPFLFIKQSNEGNH